jgi:hypothetical protein
MEKVFDTIWKDKLRIRLLCMGAWESKVTTLNGYPNTSLAG